MDALKNLAVSAVATAPSPATSGTSLVVTAGHGTRFAAVPFNAYVSPANTSPDDTNTTLIRVTNIATDTLTIVRDVEGSNSRAIQVGDVIRAGPTKAWFDDLIGRFDADGFRKNPHYACDFMDKSNAALTPFVATSTVTGSIIDSTVSPDINHPGVVSIRSSTSSNSGMLIAFNWFSTGFPLAGKLFGNLIFQVITLENTSFRFGFQDAFNSGGPIDGAYIEFVAGGNAVGKTANNSTFSTTSTDYTLSTGTWYRLKVEMNSDATLATFTIFNDSGSVLWTDTLSSNIPTTLARSTNFGVIATNSGTTQLELVALDYMDVGTTGLTR